MRDQMITYTSCHVCYKNQYITVLKSRSKGLNVVLFRKIKHLSDIIKGKFHIVKIILFLVRDVLNQIPVTGIFH